jgi:hypothetical protein
MPRLRATLTSPRVVVAVCAVAFVVLAVILFAAPLTEKRTRIASVGAPSPVAETIPIRARPGQVVCATRALLSPDTQVVEVVVDQGSRPMPPLEVWADAPGYRSPPARVPAGEPGRHGVTTQITPPDRDMLGRVCLRNAGRAPVTFVGTREFRTITRLITTVDGTPIEPDLTLTLYSATPVSVAGELSHIVDRMTISRGFLGAEWLVWTLLVLVAVGVPAATLAALYRALSPR